MPPTDAELMRACRRGDEAAFEELYLRHRDWVAAVAMRFSGDADEALDVMQEAFAWLIRRIPDLDLEHRLRSLLYPVIKHLARDRRVKRQGEGARRSAADPDTLADVAPAPPAPDGFDALLQGLDPPKREILTLRYADGLSLQEIATALDLPVGTVKSRLHNAVAELRRKLQEG